MQLREKNENQDSYLERHQNVITSFLHNPHAGKPPTPRLNNSHKFFIFQTGFGGHVLWPPSAGQKFMYL